ncbi:MAG: hypothetical protein EOO28_30405 [Comamonadaceae bacterium]|nr:MAG: hypothetical protein EOO28_30405 [Comamonadaceae bacterium]
MKSFTLPESTSDGTQRRVLGSHMQAVRNHLSAHGDAEFVGGRCVQRRRDSFAQKYAATFKLTIMNINALAIVALVLVGIQMSIAWMVTKKNMSFFKNAATYGIAVRNLYKSNPKAGLTIVTCYLASAFETLLIVFLKKYY